jgi:hypothetical protein
MGENMKIRFYGCLIGAILIIIGYYLLVMPEKHPQIKRREPRILENYNTYKNEKKKIHSDISNERLVEIIDPNYDKKYPKSN